MPVRMAAKKKNTRGGIMALVPSVALLGASAYAFTMGGAAVLGVVAGAVGVALGALGISLLKKARSGSLN